ncbi:iron chelate uptake ABC transporter family permease subunit [Georgenia subflava]|uniref:Iron chelate uptake ABC transporter family permease subunit n=1 Tax=Georgenia subflava TaxID=1622177 RepID=A0A6N7EJQ1_9MICO|nr:iron chelate uptake ABC transporter family permease subunit [Georgenia subflava]
MVGGAAVVVVLALVSLFVGVSDLSVADILRGDLSARDAQTLLVSRVPRTVSILLAGSAMAVVGLVMQLLVRNKFVEPSTAGTTESAGLGLLVVTLLAPAMPLAGKMGVAAVFALAGTMLFLTILRRIQLRSVVVVPLVGMMLAGVIGALSTFLAYRNDLLHTLSSWMTGDFSGVVRGRYEMLWIVAGCAVVAYLAANRFTVAGLGEEFTTNLGLNYRRVLALGLGIVAVTSAVVVVVVGGLPFLGLVVPNIVSLAMGDYLRRSLPWVALLGAAFVLVCDIIGRLVIHPAEIPIGIVVGVVGAGLFLYLLLRRPSGAR